MKMASCYMCYPFPSRPEPQPWLQVDLKTPKLISGVVTQGSPDMPRWVAAYTLSYSLDGVNFTPYTSVVLILVPIALSLSVCQLPVYLPTCLSVSLPVFLSVCLDVVNYTPYTPVAHLVFVLHSS